jgi:GT2 family glycosyltransferase
LNDDISVIAPDWLEHMLQYCQRPGMGAVGCRLYYPDGNIQHVGQLFVDTNEYGRFPIHLHWRGSSNEPGPQFILAACRNWQAVTGAALMTPRAVFDACGGLSEDFPSDFSDTDYCMKARSLGYRIVLAASDLFHCEAASRTVNVSMAEVERFRDRWPVVFEPDPYALH